MLPYGEMAQDLIDVGPYARAYMGRMLGTEGEEYGNVLA
jgi:hypothetical protein